MSEIETWRDCRRPSEKEREKYRDKSGLHAPQCGGEKILRRERVFAGSLCTICDLEHVSVVMALAERGHALAERGNKNYATVTEASDHWMDAVL